ncbi:MAG: hypothetical protein ACERKV_12050 [Clostridiaceae bacterium]
MAFPTDLPVLTQAQSVNAISEAEAGIAQCLQELFCDTLAVTIAAELDPDKQAALTKTVLCAYSAKEKAMGTLINALAKKILADKGLVAGNTDDDCPCDC